MHFCLALLSLVPMALGCSNKETGSYASATPKATTTTTITTLKTSATAGIGGRAAPTGLTTTLPKASGTVTTATKPMTISGSFDGGMKLYDRSSKVCKEQSETGEAGAMFVLEAGATLSNVIIGPNQAEGVHCRGTCTLNNVWWQDVCEDALTLKQSSGTSYVNGGGAFHAADKIIQFNGFGTVKVKSFYAQDYGKVSRSCGNCSNNGKARHLVLDNVMAVDGGIICGINSNYGDTCTITNSCQNQNKSCDRYQGNNNGGEPTKLGSGNDGQHCIVQSFTSAC